MLGREMIGPVDSVKRLSRRDRLMGEKVNPPMMEYGLQKIFCDVVSFNRLIFYISKFKVLWGNGLRHWSGGR